MPVKKYNYEISGTDANGNEWATTGVVNCEFVDVFRSATGDAFFKLTRGKAVYGKPGVGCRGPYQVHLVRLTEARDAAQ